MGQHTSNVFLLGCTGYTSPYFLTFNQANRVGARVRKGEKGYPVIFWKFGVTKSSVLCRYYTVFNVAQVEGLDVPPEMLEPSVPSEPIAECEALVDGFTGCPTIRHGSNGAWDTPSLDIVSMPERGLFISPEHYYSTLFHELTHSTGHKSRLDRVGITDLGRFGDVNYSKEELIAEMGAAYLCGLAGIENKTINESASYLQGWLFRLRNDPKLLISAASQAQKSVDYMTGRTSKAVDQPALAVAA